MIVVIGKLSKNVTYSVAVATVFQFQLKVSYFVFYFKD